MRDAITAAGVLTALAAGFFLVRAGGGGVDAREFPPAPPVSGEEPCEAHGAPADVCVFCHPDLAEQFRDQGDWCAGHNRPESQCYT